MSGAKLTPYQEGYRDACRAGLPEIPEGYRRGNVHGPAFIHLPATVCEACGAVVGDTGVHTAWHAAQGAAASAAYRADVMTSVIGPGATLVDEGVPNLLDGWAADGETT